MHFTVNRETLMIAVSAALRAVPSRSPLPITAGFLMKAEENSVELTGTDLELMIRCRVPALEVYREGEVVVPARQVSEIIRRLGEGKIEVQGSGPNVVMTYAGGEVQLAGYLPEEFPLLTLEGEEKLPIKPGPGFREALRCTLYAAGKDELRPVFTGVQFEVRDGVLTLAATDGHRLAVHESTVGSGAAASSIIPAKALREVERVIGQLSEDLTISLAPGQAAFFLDGVEIYTRLIEGRFPEWRAAIPQNQAHTLIRGNRLNFINGVERAQVMAGSDVPSVIIRVSGGNLSVHAQSEVGGLRETLSMQTEGEDVEVAFNSTYLLEALRAAESESVEVGFNGNMGPAVIRLPDSPGYLALVLPLRLL
ncbi:MAG: DNA polymerase III subunit beta [Bacillota bacterium]